jgi:hypothetical protein
LGLRIKLSALRENLRGLEGNRVQFVVNNTGRWSQSARRQRLFVSVAFLLALLTSGCQTFNMTPEKFAQQQKGRYDCSPEARTVEVAGTLLYFMGPFLGCRMPGPVPEL